MASDAEITLAFVAKRQGAESFGASTWANVLSLELGWMTPGVAKAFIADCQSSGLLLPDGEDLRLSFDHKPIHIPKRYRPPADLAVAAEPPSASTAASTDRFPELIARIAKEGALSKDEVLGEVSAVQEQFGGRLSAEAAAIKVALASGLDVQADAEAALGRIMSMSK